MAAEKTIIHNANLAHAYPLDLETLVITLQAGKGDLVRCYLFYGDHWERNKPLKKAKMEKVASDDLFDYFRIKVKAPSRRMYYVFLVDDCQEKLWFSEKGLTREKPKVGELELPYFKIPNIRKNDIFSVPEWARGAVVYQIFPDRFYNGDKTNDPPNTKEWGKLPVTEDTLHGGAKDTFYGGDLRGIIEKIPYLSELGVDAIYLTPIFSSPSSHKYDPTDYYQIDPHFGDLETFKELVHRCHENKIKVILDGVFDHCGYNFFAFQDVVKKGPKSEYVDWFNIYSFPVKTRPKPTYETWGKDLWWMPRLMTENPGLRKYLLEAAVYWTKEAEIDGWRLDVASEMDHDFWREFRKAVKKANPDAIIIGEVPHHASPWLEGDQLDSVMNYHFRLLMIDFFAKGTIGVEEFDAGLAKLRMMYKQPVNEVIYNLLGSHDTARFLTLCGNKTEKMMLAVIFQMTYPGMPAIYYGDEVGMSGSNYLEARKAMVWDKANQNQELFELYKKLIAIRKNHSALARGEFTTTLVDPETNVYSYVRSHEDERIFIGLNNSPHKQIVSLPTPGMKSGMILINLLNGERFKVTKGAIHVTLRAYSGAIFSKR